MELTACNKINLNKLKSLENPKGINAFRFAYERELEKALRNIGVNINMLGLDDGDTFWVIVSPSVKHYLKERFGEDIEVEPEDLIFWNKFSNGGVYRIDYNWEET